VIEANKIDFDFDFDFSKVFSARVSYNLFYSMNKDKPLPASQRIAFLV
jgi:hypothetical protein